MDIREIGGLWCDDITFCQETCKRMDCPRNKHHIRDRGVPHSFSVEIPSDCPKKQEGRRSGMTETDKLLVRIGTARDAISRKTELTSLDYMIDGVLMNCSVLLKEQETEKKCCRDCEYYGACHDE